MFAWCLWLALGVTIKMPYYRLLTNQLRAACYYYGLWLAIGGSFIAVMKPSDEVNGVFAVVWVAAGVIAAWLGYKVVEWRFAWLSRITHKMVSTGMRPSAVASRKADSMGITRLESGYGIECDRGAQRVPDTMLSQLLDER